MTARDCLEKIKYSIVIPVFNEEDSIRPLFHSLKEIMNAEKENYEIIFINDGSQDNTLEVLRELSKGDRSIRVINFGINRGQGSAMEEGFCNTRGEIIITMDGDLQNDPLDIPKLIAEIEQGFDVVCGWRYDRKDKIVKRIKSKIGNFLQRIITHLDLHDMSCTLRAYRKEVVAAIKFKGRFDFSILPYIISKRKNIKITEVKIHDNYRKFGKTKYRLLTTIFGTIYDYIRTFFH